MRSRRYLVEGAAQTIVRILDCTETAMAETRLSTHSELLGNGQAYEADTRSSK